MAVDIIFGNPGLQQNSAFPVQSPYQDDLMQGLLSTLGVCPQSLPNLWVQDPDTTHSSTQAYSETSVYSNPTEITHPIKTEEDYNTHVEVETETCSCDVCSRLFGGACHLLQFEGNIRGSTPIAIENEYYTEENTVFANITALRSDDEHLAEFTCEVCGEKLVENQDIYNISKKLSFSSNDADKHFSDKFCLTCLMNYVATSIHEKCDMLDDVTNGIEYECSVCMSVFQSRTETYKHMNTHDRIQNHVCPFCQNQFSDGKQFYSHFLTHEQEQEFTCRLCRKVFTAENKYRSHVKSHTVADTPSKHHDDAGTGDTDKCKRANDNMYSTTSRYDINVIRNCDVSARFQCGGDSSTDIHYKDLVESVEASSKRDCDSNMASDDVPAVINDCEACDAASSNGREHDIHLKSSRDLRIKANCSKPERLAGSVGSLSDIICLENDRIEISNVGKTRTKTGKGKPEEEEYNHIEATSEKQEGRKNGCRKASSNGNKGTKGGQIIDISGDQEGVVQKQNTSKLRDIQNGDKSQDVLPEHTCMIKNNSKEFPKEVETETKLEKEECNLTWKKHNIDKSKKLHIRKTLVIPKTQHFPLTKRQTDGNNNELLFEEGHFKQQQKTTAVEAKKHLNDKNKKKLSHEKNKNLTSDKCEKLHSTKKTVIPPVKSPIFCSVKDSNGKKTLISNFLLVEESLDCIPQNQKQSSMKRHLSKRNRFKSAEKRSKNIKLTDSSDSKSCNVITMIKRRKYSSSVTSQQWV